ncbi:MAG TPA: AI-2E family transporter [Vicinamibacterales bacterium]|nr:AI-2E family transporter [Vicinamibacterales bacterium]
MAESEDKPTLAVVPTQITAIQIIAFLLSLAALRYARGFLAPLMVAVLVALALAPPVRQLARAMPRWLASGIVVLGIGATVAATTWLLWDDLAVFSRRLPAIVRDIRETIQSASPRQGLLRQLQQAVSELERATAPPKPTEATPVQIVEPLDVQRQMMSGARTAGGYLLQGVLLLFLVYFLLASGDLIKTKVVKLSGDRLSQRKVTVQMIDEISTKISRFVFYMFWSGAVVGLATWLAFWLLGMRYAGLWGVAAGVLNCIPYFGPTVIMVASAVAALLQFQSLSMIAAVSGASVLITAIEGFLLMPIFLGQAARVNSVAVFVSVMFWGWLWGALGMLLAVPILMMMKTIADRVETLSSLSELLDER